MAANRLKGSHRCEVSSSSLGQQGKMGGRKQKVGKGITPRKTKHRERSKKVRVHGLFTSGQ